MQMNRQNTMNQFQPVQFPGMPNPMNQKQPGCMANQMAPPMNQNMMKQHKIQYDATHCRIFWICAA